MMTAIILYVCLVGSWMLSLCQREAQMKLDEAVGFSVTPVIEMKQQIKDLSREISELKKQLAAPQTSNGATKGP